MKAYQMSVMYEDSILIDLKFHLLNKDTHTHTYPFPPKAQ